MPPPPRSSLSPNSLSISLLLFLPPQKPTPLLPPSPTVELRLGSSVAVGPSAERQANPRWSDEHCIMNIPVSPTSATPSSWSAPGDPTVLRVRVTTPSLWGGPAAPRDLIGDGFVDLARVIRAAIETGPVEEILQGPGHELIVPLRSVHGACGEVTLRVKVVPFPYFKSWTPPKAMVHAWHAFTDVWTRKVTPAPAETWRGLAGSLESSIDSSWDSDDDSTFDQDFVAPMSNYLPMVFLDNVVTDTECWIYRDAVAKEVVVAFRGTEVEKWRDHQTNLNLLPTPIEDRDGLLFPPSDDDEEISYARTTEVINHLTLTTHTYPPSCHVSELNPNPNPNPNHISQSSPISSHPI